MEVCVDDDSVGMGCILRLFVPSGKNMRYE